MVIILLSPYNLTCLHITYEDSTATEREVTLLRDVRRRPPAQPRLLLGHGDRVGHFDGCLHDHGDDINYFDRMFGHGNPIDYFDALLLVNNNRDEYFIARPP